MSPTSYRLTPLSLYMSNRPSQSQIWPWKSKTEVMGEVKGRGHMISPALIRWISVLLHVNRSNHSYRYISISGWFQESVIISFSHELYIYMITNSTQYHIDLPIVFKLPRIWIFPHSVRRKGAQQPIKIFQIRFYYIIVYRKPAIKHCTKKSYLK